MFFIGSDIEDWNDLPLEVAGAMASTAVMLRLVVCVEHRLMPFMAVFQIGELRRDIRG